MNRRRICLLASAFFMPPMALAAEAPKPVGEVILTVSGAIDNSNATGAYAFDLDMIKALPAVEVETASPWTDGIARFKGVTLKDLLAATGAKGKSLSATAINDYAVDIPAEDWEVHGAFVAYEMNGEKMSVREKGPLWVLYPFDTKPDLKAEAYYARAIWQLKSIEVKP